MWHAGRGGEQLIANIYVLLIGPWHLTKTPYPPLWKNHKTVTYIQYVVVLQFFHINESEASAKCHGPLHPELLFIFLIWNPGNICWVRGVRTPPLQSEGTLGSVLRPKLLDAASSAA
jgi:hypothetical protein